MLNKAVIFYAAGYHYIAARHILPALPKLSLKASRK